MAFPENAGKFNSHMLRSEHLFKQGGVIYVGYIASIDFWKLFFNFYM